MRSPRRALLPAVLLAGGLLLTGCSGSSMTHTAAQEKKVTADLARIDAGFGGKESLNDVKAICAEMRRNTADATVLSDARTRFAQHSIATLTAAQSAQIVSTIKTDYCT